jgi:hypothetical protein
LRPDSPAIGAGLRLPDAPSRDYFGDPVPADAPPSVGIDEPPNEPR